MLYAAVPRKASLKTKTCSLTHKWLLRIRTSELHVPVLRSISLGYLFSNHWLHMVLQTVRYETHLPRQTAAGCGSDRCPSSTTDFILRRVVLAYCSLYQATTVFAIFGYHKRSCHVTWTRRDQRALIILWTAQPGITVAGKKCYSRNDPLFMPGW